MDYTLAKAGASRKSRAIFRSIIYAAASGVARVLSTDGKFIFSDSFNVGRGVAYTRMYSVSRAIYNGARPARSRI